LDPALSERESVFKIEEIRTQEMMNERHELDLENMCREFSGAFQKRLSWKWDSRFETVLAEFSVDDQEGVRKVLDRYLSMTWDRSTVGSAPDIVQTITSDFGGLMPGQLLFTSDPSLDALLFCAWWPWGDGKTISIRVAPSTTKPLDSEKGEQNEALKGWFGI
jgi:hypothetical protein